MFSLTKQERFVLVFFAVVFLSGTALNAAFKRFPYLHDIVNVMDSEIIYPKVDVNAAAYDELLKIPYVGPATARAILDYRKILGPFESLEQLVDVPTLNEKRLKRIKLYLKVRRR